MKVKLKTIYSGPEGTYQPGETPDLKDGQDLIDGGYAETVIDMAAEVDSENYIKIDDELIKLKPTIETADVKPEETEEAPKKRSRKGKL